MKKTWLLILVLISLCINPQITIPVGAEDPSGGIIDGDGIYWENDWGRLEVYPHTTWGEIHQEQYCNATWKLAANDLDIAFRFEDALIDAHVYELVGAEWVERTENFEHTIYNGKHYYYVQSVHFEQDETRRFKWNYDVPFNSSGKWDFMAKLSSESIQYALDNNRYVMLDPWWDSKWGYYSQLDIDSSKIDTDLANFPVLVVVDSTVAGKCQADGDDIRFLKMDNTTILDYEIELWNPAGDSYLWVEVDTIDSAVDTSFLCYYSNDDASSGEDQYGTWDINFAGVWHMDGATCTAIDDSTNNYNNVTNCQGSPQYEQTGIVGYGVNTTTGALGILNTTISSGLNLTDLATLEVWFNQTGSGNQHIIDRWNATIGDRTYAFRTSGDQGQTLASTDGANDFSATSTGGLLDGDDWHYGSGKHETGQKLQSYINKTVTVGDVVANDIYLGEADLWFGINEGRYGNFQGVIDEIRISNIKRNTSWTNATYHSITQDLITWGTEQAGVGLVINATTSITTTTATLNAWFSAGEPYTGNYDYGFWIGQTSPVTAANAEQNVSDTPVTPGNTFSIAVTSLDVCTDYYAKAWVSNATFFNESDNEDTFTTYSNPNPPTDVDASITGSDLVITWTQDDTGCSENDNTSIIRKVGSYPSSVSDGTEVYNDTGATHTETDVTGTYYYRLWGWNETLELHSSTYADVEYGTLILYCYNESNPSDELLFSIEIKNSDGSVVYTNTSISDQPLIIDVDDIPYGDDTLVKVNATSDDEVLIFETRHYYYDFVLNNVYNISFYLPLRNLTELYLLDVKDQTGQPISSCKIQVQRYNNVTEQYENVSILLTDGAGYSFVFLIPEISYQINLSKTGYITQIADYTPLSDVFTQSFVLLFEEEDFENITGDWWEDITFEGYMSSTTLTVNYTDTLDETINVSFIVYEYNYTTFNLTAIYWWNSTDQSDPTDNDFQFSTSDFNSSNMHRVQMFLNHTTHGYVPHSIEFVPADQAYRGITTITRLDELLDDLLGENPFGWGNFFAFWVLVACLFSFGEQGVGISLMGTGFLFLFLSVVIRIFAIMLVVPVLFIILGILVEWNIRQRRLKY